MTRHMTGWLPWKKRRTPERLLQDIVDRLEKLEARLKDQTAGKPDVHIAIERLDIHQPVLEQLSFRLDSLTIRELSGALNLGNNFATNVGRKEPAAPGKTGTSKRGGGNGEGGFPEPKEELRRSAPTGHGKREAADMPEGSATMRNTEKGFSMIFG